MCYTVYTLYNIQYVRVCEYKNVSYIAKPEIQKWKLGPVDFSQGVHGPLGPTDFLQITKLLNKSLHWYEAISKLNSVTKWK